MIVEGVAAHDSVAAVYRSGAETEIAFSVLMIVELSTDVGEQQRVCILPQRHEELNFADDPAATRLE